MADQKISALTAKTTPIDTDVIELVDTASTPVSKKLTWANIKATLKTYFDTLYQPVGGGAGVPTGAVIPFAGASAPTDWLLCDGSAVSRTTYATLFALIGTTFGVGNGSSTFNLPDMRSSFPIGVGGKTLTATAKTANSADIDELGSIISFSSAHGFRDGERLTVAGSQPPEYDSGTGTSSGSVSVDGSGNVAVGGTFAALAPVGTVLYCSAQSSSNFGAGAYYYVISNNGSSITVSGTRGGSLAGSGNSGSVTFRKLTTINGVALAIISSIYCRAWDGSVSGTWFYGDTWGSILNTMFDTTEPIKPGDVFNITEVYNLSGISTGTYYFLDVDYTSKRFTLATSPGGSAVSMSGSGYIAGNVTRPAPVFYAQVIDATKLRLAVGQSAAVGFTDYQRFYKGGTGTGTFTLTGEDKVFSSRSLGDVGGDESVLLSLAELPNHQHRKPYGTSGSGSNSGSEQYSHSSSGVTYGVTSSPNATARNSTAWPEGRNEPHSNIPPFVALNYIIKS